MVALFTITALLIGRADSTMKDNAATPEQTRHTTAEEDRYVGLSESEALDKADRENVPARVVTRDDEPLPTTEDLRPGRLNLTVKDDIVTHVSVE